MNRIKLISVLTSVFAAFVLTFTGGAGWCGGMEPGMMGSGQSGNTQKPGDAAGAKIFSVNCRRCHPNGGNIIVPDLPLIGSQKLSEFKTFLSFIRDPKMPDGSEGVMPSFSRRQISDREAKKLYQYISSAQSSGAPGGGYGMGQGMMGGRGMGQGMMGGYGMGRGMMGDYGMGRGMMGGRGMGQGMMGGYGMGRGMMGGYSQSEECQKFLNKTAGLRKELHDKRFEYTEAYRNPKTTQETLFALDKEIHDLQSKIYAEAPMGCGW